MSWSDRIGDAVATFRSVEIILENTSQNPGRRVQVHEYPLRDQPYAEDLGRKAREWQIDGFLIGEDYDLARDRLIAAVEQPGAGELVHPYYGTHRVVVVDGCRIRESTREGGMARISMTVVRADDEPRQPKAVQDTRAEVQARAEAAKAEVLEDFKDDYSVLELAVDRVQAVEKGLQESIRTLEETIGGVTGPIAALIRAPAELGTQILEATAQVTDLISEPGRALSIYSDLFGAGGSVPETALLDPPPRIQQMAAMRASQNLVRRAAVIQAAELSATVEWQTAEEALSARDTIVAGIELQLSSSHLPTDSVYSSLTALRAAVVRDLEQRGAQLPRLRTVTLRQALPSLLVAHTLYGDAARAPEIVSRNAIRHPGFVPAGQKLQVLTE